MYQKFRDGRMIRTENGQERLLKLLYGNLIGRLLLKPLTTPIVSELAGAFLSTRFSCVFIKPFIKKNAIDMSQFKTEKYKSYNEFFSRQIRAGARPVDRTKAHLISPCDSKLTVYSISKKSHFCIKHTDYSVASLLKDKTLAREYEGGYALVFRLTVDDYHRYCYVADGVKSENRKIPGVLHTVNPIANDVYPIYKENAREYCVIQSKEFGKMVMMEVGALLVGKIVNHHGKKAVLKGQEKGYFRFGGSTVVLLVKKGMIKIDDDILKNSEEGCETIVKYGEKIAMATEM